MERHRRTVGYYDQTRLTAPERDQMISKLRRCGYTHRRVGKAVGMSANGVMQALRRMAHPAPPPKAQSQVLRQVRAPRA
jgi:hypothetical protein